MSARCCHLAAGWFGFRAWRRGTWALPGEFLPSVIGWIGFIGAVYAAGIFMTIMTTKSQDPLRHNLPVYPLVLARLAGAASPIRLNGIRPVTGLVALVVPALQTHDFGSGIDTPLHVTVARDLQQEVRPGESLQHWLLDHVPPGAVIVAQENQALYYLLHRPVVAMVEPPDVSLRRSDSGAFLDLMSHYKSTYLVLFPVSIRPPIRVFSVRSCFRRAALLAEVARPDA